MNSIEHVRNVIDQEVFDYTQLMLALTDYRKPRDLLTSLMQEGRIIRIRKGLYIFGDAYRRSPIPTEMLANLIYGPSLISLDFALSWYGLIPERVYEITSISTGRSRRFDTPVGRYSYHQVSPIRMAYGATIVKRPAGNWIMCEPVKALADKVWTDKRFNPTSRGAYPDYIFEDLRIDEKLLGDLCKKADLVDLEKNYAARKISWLVEFLKSFYNLI